MFPGETHRQQFSSLVAVARQKMHDSRRSTVTTDTNTDVVVIDPEEEIPNMVTQAHRATDRMALVAMETTDRQSESPSSAATAATTMVRNVSPDVSQSSDSQSCIPNFHNAVDSDSSDDQLIRRSVLLGSEGEHSNDSSSNGIINNIPPLPPNDNHLGIGPTVANNEDTTPVIPSRDSDLDNSPERDSENSPPVSSNDADSSTSSVHHLEHAASNNSPRSQSRIEPDACTEDRVLDFPVSTALSTVSVPKGVSDRESSDAGTPSPSGVDNVSYSETVNNPASGMNSPPSDPDYDPGMSVDISAAPRRSWRSKLRSRLAKNLSKLPPQTTEVLPQAVEEGGTADVRERIEAGRPDLQNEDTRSTVLFSDDESTERESKPAVLGTGPLIQRTM